MVYTQRVILIQKDSTNAKLSYAYMYYSGYFEYIIIKVMTNLNVKALCN